MFRSKDAHAVMFQTHTWQLSGQALIHLVRVEVDPEIIPTKETH